MLNLKMIIGSTRIEGALPPAVMRQLAGEGARR